MEPNVAANKPIRVLFVEDEIPICEWVVEELSEQGFAVQAVTNAEEALDHLTENPVDVLFTDINLPGMDGATLARRARELKPHLPVFYASGRATMLTPDARVPGAIIVPKPYEPALVGRLLNAVLRQASTGAPAG